MHQHYSANVISFSLLLLIGIFAFLFLGKQQYLYYQRNSQQFYQDYLSFQLHLTDIITQSHIKKCEKMQKAKIIENHQGAQYSFKCRRRSLFMKHENKKYIQVDNIHDWLDIDYYHNEIIEVTTLADLPNSSKENPKIIRVLNPIDETLLTDFYGIVITDYYFDISGKYKIYGCLYSSYNNQRDERNLTYKQDIINNLEEKYSRWEYIPRTRSLLSNEKTF